MGVLVAGIIVGVVVMTGTPGSELGDDRFYSA